MKNILLTFLCAAFLIPGTAAAKSSSHPTADTKDHNNGIVTPDVAENMFRTSYFVQSPKGILVCVDTYSEKNGVTCTKDGKNAWRSMRNSVPAGKTYVGFKSITAGSYGSHFIEVYWK
jgi:hypothetical protein